MDFTLHSDKCAEIEEALKKYVPQHENFIAGFEEGLYKSVVKCKDSWGYAFDGQWGPKTDDEWY